MNVPYWTTHKYHRRKVQSTISSHDSDFKGWMGWRKFSKICQSLEDDGRKQKLLVALFFCGSRANEILLAKRSNFSILDKAIRVTNLPVFKRLKHRRFESGVWMHRNFLINLEEPETETLVQLLDELGEDDSDKRLFDFKYNTLYNEITGIRQANLFPHVLRAHRASQLVSDYHFDTFLLKSFFGWKKDETPAHYVALGLHDMEKAYGI